MPRRPFLVHFAIDYQDGFTNQCAPVIGETFKAEGRDFADRFADKGNLTIWTAMPGTPRHWARQKAGLFLPPTHNGTPDARDRLIKKSLRFDPSLLRPQDGFYVKLMPNAVMAGRNPCVAYMETLAPSIHLVVTGLNTPKCVAATVVSASNKNLYEQVTVITDQLLDVRREKTKRLPPTAHQAIVAGTHYINAQKVSYMTKAAFFRKYGM